MAICSADRWPSGTVSQVTPRPAGCRRSFVANQVAREATRLLEDVEAVQPKETRGRRIGSLATRERQAVMSDSPGGHGATDR